MSTTPTQTPSHVSTVPPRHAGPVPGDSRPPAAAVPLGRIITVELRKMFDTRAGFWLLVAIAVTALVATVSVIAFAPEEVLTYDSFAAAIGVPMAVLLPIMAILSVTSEWSQRSGLTTFTMVPRRGKVMVAKGIAAVAVGVVSISLAGAIGAIGNVAGSALVGIDTVWDVSATQLALITLAQVLGMLVGFTLGVLIRSSAAAVVGYFVYAFVAPTAFEVLAAFQEWFRDIRPWMDFNGSTSRLYGTVPDGEVWAQIAVSGTIWLVLPLVLGLVTMRRSEVK